jgi:glutamate-ammonia-ligase adenylyltransferase
VEFLNELQNLECVSPVMRDALRRHPEWVEWLKQRIDQPGPAADVADSWNRHERSARTGADMLAAFRNFKQRALIEIAFRDVAGLASFEQTIDQLSRLADIGVAVALEASWCELAALRPAEIRAHEGFAVIALGKLGGRELNYSSDVDLIFCRRTSDNDQEMRFFTRLGERLVQMLGRPEEEGFLYRVDMRLRPLGETGTLVPTIDSLENYYESWGEAWERQALIKARPICGDEALGCRFQAFAAKFTFARQMDDSSLEEIKRVKHRAEKEYARSPERIHIKQGPGGIRDIEFYVQYLQLIAGSRHPEVRVQSTLSAIRALASAKALLEGEESQLALAYVFLRIIEHRLQLRSLTPQALLPDERGEIEFLASGLGFPPGPMSAAAAFLATLRSYRERVRAILERIYLTPGHLRPRDREEEFAQLLSERTPRERVKQLLSQYGFSDAERAWQNIRLLALGPAGHMLPPGERRAFLEIVFALLEVLRESYDPDYALHRLESFAAACGNRVSFLRALASRRPHLARISNLLALSNLGHQILTRHPEYFDSLARGIHLLEGRERAEMSDELAERLRTAPAGQGPDVLRRYRQREMIRIAYRDLAELAGPLHISRELSELAEACLRVGIGLAAHQKRNDERAAANPLIVVALGKLGSQQMHYSSDLDLLILYEDLPENSTPEERTELQLLQDDRVATLLEILAAVTTEGIAYKIDLRLRPEGATGMLARSWSSFREHARRFMQPWERMALVRSRILANSDEVKARWSDILSEIVYDFSWNQESLESIRHLKRRIESETNKESRICLDFKFGKGGICDLEFLVQMLQVVYGRTNPGARAPGIADAVEALAYAGAISEQERRNLQTAHVFHRRVENHYQMIEEWTSREVSRESPVLERLARSLGYREDSAAEARKAFLCDWEHHAQQVRSMVERCFYRG